MLATLLAVVAAVVLLRVLIRRRPETHRISYVCDGDSFLTEKGTRVRLLSIDAPELGQAASHAAREALMALMPPGTTIRLRGGRRTTDLYGRRLAYVETLAGEKVNLAMVRAGHAVPNVHRGDGGIYGLRIHLAALGARLARRGAWANRGFAVRPDRYRREHQQAPRLSRVELGG